MREEIFNMTQKEITRLRVINQTIDKVITIREADELLEFYSGKWAIDIFLNEGI
jgi:hypothetical protein